MKLLQRGEELVEAQPTPTANILVLYGPQSARAGDAEEKKNVLHSDHSSLKKTREPGGGGIFFMPSTPDCFGDSLSKPHFAVDWGHGPVETARCASAQRVAAAIQLLDAELQEVSPVPWLSTSIMSVSGFDIQRGVETPRSTDTHTHSPTHTHTLAHVENLYLNDQFPCSPRGRFVTLGYDGYDSPRGRPYSIPPEFSGSQHTADKTMRMQENPRVDLLDVLSSVNLLSCFMSPHSRSLQ